MSQHPGAFAARHNREQRAYFEGAPKRTMLPADTPYVRRQVSALLDFGGIRPGERVIEVGCGMGRYTLDLVERGLRVEGLDLSPKLLDQLRAFDGGRHDIPLHCADVVDHPSELRGRYDAVIGFFALHHFHDLDACFQAMARLLAPGGRAVFLEPNPYNPLYYAQILLTPGMSWRSERGIAEMRPERVFRAMASAGLAEPALRRFGFLPPLLTNAPGGERAEELLERFPVWRRALPFQLFRGTLRA
jgi:SAM-dependent methyltransferase